MIEIDGRSIQNYHNEFWTDIALVNEDGVTSFLLNKGEELCGAVTLTLENPGGKYFYLYNDSKGKYELLKIQDVRDLKLTTAGQYCLRETRLNGDRKVLLYSIAGGVIFVIIGGVIYVFVKKKYWFW